MHTSQSPTVRKKAVRNSAIEMLKIAAILGIVLGHTSGGIGNPDVIHGFAFSESSWDFNHIFVQLVNFLCSIGNNVFWICSCWFLAGDDRMSKRKVFDLIVDVWLISVIILGIVYYNIGDTIPKEYIKRSLLPTSYENNWFITCYILMYAVHPLLNLIIRHLSQKALFRTSFTFTLLYIVSSAISPGHYFPSMPIIWTAVYFIVAYIKLYNDESSKNIQFNCACIVVCVLAITSCVITLNYLDTHRGIHLTNVLLWNVNENPFVIVLALSIFNLVRNFHYENRAVNTLAGLTLFIYLIHENLLLRTYFRPKIWNMIYDIDGYRYFELDCILFAIAVFIASVILSQIYVSIIKKPLSGVTGAIYEKLRRRYLKVESRIFQRESEPYGKSDITIPSDAEIK